jgi:hypothetical protein
MLWVWPPANFFHVASDATSRRISRCAVAWGLENLVQLCVIGFSPEHIFDHKKINPECIGCDLDAALDAPFNVLHEVYCRRNVAREKRQFPPDENPP